MKITYIERGKPFDYKRIDTIKTIIVQDQAFTSGGLIYFRKNAFDYFVIDRDCIIKIEN